MKIRQGKDIILRWKITTNGEALPLEGRNLTLILSTPNGRERVLSYTTEGDIISTRLFGKEIRLLGDYTLTLWENRGEQGQTAVDAVDAFELVKYTTMEEDSSPCSNLEAEILSLSGDLGVFQQGTTTEKNEQVDKNTEDIAELQQDMADAKDDIHALGNSLNELGKADASLREEIVNIKDKNAEQDEEITSLLNILEGKLDIKDLGSGLRPDQAVSEIVNYVRSNNIKSALVFKYIDTDNSSTFGICISRMGTSGWIIYLVARKGLEVLKFNSYGSRETWNEYGGVLRHDMNSVADEQLECLSIKGIKSVLATKQNTLVSGTNIKSINGQSILGSGNIKIEAGITEEEKAEINAKIDAKAPKVGYAPNLKVRFAKELVGRGEATAEVIGGIRPTGVRSIGDGNATIAKIKGESVVWNQYAPDAITFKKMSTQDNITYVPTTTTTNGNVYYELGVAKGSHKYLCTGNIVNSKGIIPTAGRLPLNTVFSLANATKVYLAPLGSSDTNITTEDWVRIEEPIQFHDLTLMFGSGNEPETIEEFEARKPLGVTNEYNEGTIVSYNGEALKSVGFNAFNGTYAKVIGGEEYHATGTTSISFAKELDGDTTPITLDGNGKFTPTEDGYVYAEGTDIVIHLTHSYTPEHVDEYEEDVHPLPNISAIKDADGNQLFPYGLLSAGSVHDEITATKAIKRVGVVDMGTLNWGRFAEADIYVFQVTPTDIGVYSNTTSVPNLLNKAYPSVIRADIKAKDKCISQNNGAKPIVIRDDAYTDVDSFKASLQGVLLYYELAEPIEVDLPEPLNMTYEAWDFGTEELIHKGATTPLNADIVYQFNAVDRIRENSSAIEDLEGHVEEGKDDGIELLTNGNLKLTLKGATREFMPATPSGDPMHYAYESAGAEYNATTDYILKDAPWKDMVDTIEDKAKWSLDVVDASKVQQMTIKGVEYNYATENRASPEGGTYLRYFLVGQGSNGFWVEDETKVLHLPNCWYLNGLGDITNAEMRRMLEEKEVKYRWDKIRGGQNIRSRTIIPINNIANLDMIPSLATPYNIQCESICVTFIEHFIANEHAKALSVSSMGATNKTRYIQTCKNASGTPFANARVVSFIKLDKNCTMSDVRLLSKPSILYTIENAAPTSAISITLHADAYARLAEDADIVAALEAQPLVTLVSA